MFNLSPDNAISKSFKTFGVTEASEHVLVCLLGDAVHQATLEKLIDGTLADASQLERVSRLEDIKQVYQINESEANANSVVNAVINRISSKISKKAEMR